MADEKSLALSHEEKVTLEIQERQHQHEIQMAELAAQAQREANRQDRDGQERIERQKTERSGHRWEMALAAFGILIVAAVIGSLVAIGWHISDKNNAKNLRLQTACIQAGGVYNNDDQCVYGKQQ